MRGNEAATAPLLRRLIGPIVAAIPSAESFVARCAFPQIAEVILALGWMLAGVNLLFGLLLPEHMHKARPRRVVGDVDDLVLPGRSATAVCWAGTAWIVAVAGLMWMLVALPIFDPAYGVDDEGALYAFTNRLTFGFVAQALSNLTGFAMAGCAVAAGHLAGSFVAFLRRDGSG